MFCDHDILLGTCNHTQAAACLPKRFWSIVIRIVVSLSLLHSHFLTAHRASLALLVHMPNPHQALRLASTSD